jgi:hypothetical protein
VLSPCPVLESQLTFAICPSIQDTSGPSRAIFAVRARPSRKWPNIPSWALNIRAKASTNGQQVRRPISHKGIDIIQGHSKQPSTHPRRTPCCPTCRNSTSRIATERRNRVLEYSADPKAIHW